MLTSLNPQKNIKNEIVILPNGVNFQLFQPLEQKASREKIGWNLDSRIILFGSDPSRPEKRFDLAENAVKSLVVKNHLVELKYLHNVEPDKVPYYISGSDIVLLTSDREGSPNIIKEAMACNVPIVSTQVGDVQNIVGNTTGCKVVLDNQVETIASALSDILCLTSKRTNGREKIQHLSDELIAKRLIEFYEK
jgi:glycosyltransferase involved in cell wall biosynthesis